MDCWICGESADSGEHRIKASDLRHYFGEISPRSPVFLHSDTHRNIPIHSSRSDKLKTSKVLCRRCNDTRTAAYDNAWDILRHELTQKWGVLKKTRRFKLQSAFPSAVSRQSINFHLFFVKLFGCRIADEKLPIELSEFSRSIMDDRPHPNVYLSFNMRNIPLGVYLGVSEVHAKEYAGVCEAATWYYSFGELDVQVSWFREKPIKNIPYAWHPNTGGKIVRFRQR
jgi:hypothetical protein